MNIHTLKTDKVGIIASVLCMIHCIATPFIFIATSCSATCCETSPAWYSGLDFVFLLISVIAIYQSSKNSSKAWMKYVMLSTWTLLFIVIFNEKIQLLPLIESVIYFPAILLVVLHIYNLKYCQCKTYTCCTN